MTIYISCPTVEIQPISRQDVSVRLSVGFKRHYNYYNGV